MSVHSVINPLNAVAAVLSRNECNRFKFEKIVLKHDARAHCGSLMFN